MRVEPGTPAVLHLAFSYMCYSYIPAKYHSHS